MSKYSEHIKETASYMSSLIGDDIQFEPLKKSLVEKLPYTIANSFRLYNARVLGQNVIIAIITDGNDIPPAQMQKTLTVIEKRCGCTIILCPMTIASYNLRRLTAQKVNFVMPRKQMFIPSLLIDLKKQKNIDSDLTETIPAMAQCLLLYHLEVKALDGKGTKELSELLHVSYASINRALRWLKERELIALEGVKTKTIRFECTKQKLWEKALPLLTSPIEKQMFTDQLLDGATNSGINALSEYTMINPEKRICYAIAKGEDKRLNVVTGKEFGTNTIEVWRYNPRLLSDTGTVDKLSLYLSLKDNEEERIQIELENLIKQIQW